MHPLAKVGLKILGVKAGKELAMVLSTVGLAQNWPYNFWLQGIQKGHMRLHARNIATMAGSEGSQIDTSYQKDF